MDSRNEARDFLQTRRARLAPPGGARSAVGRRRVPGLRREEVAELAGVSVDYYTRLEKGHLETASFAVLNAVSVALQLDTAESSHLHALARAARGESGATPVRPDESTVRPGLTWVLDAMTLCPAYVRNGRLEVVASNALGRTLFEPLFAPGEERPNLAAFCFLDPRAREVFTAWHDVARGTVALLRAEVGRHGSDETLGALVDHLLARSDVFASLWVEHGVREAFSDVKHLHHPRVGDLVLATETQTSVADPGLTVVAYAAEPGSRSEWALRTLAQDPELREGLGEGLGVEKLEDLGLTAG